MKALLLAAAVSFCAGAAGAWTPVRSGDGTLPGLVRQLRAETPAAIEPGPAPTAEWTVMVYVNAKNDLEYFGLADLNEMEAAGSTDRVAVVVEFGILGIDNNTDRNLQFQRGSKTIYVTRDADANTITSPVIYNSNTADMGSEAHLLRFIKRGLRQYPARKVAVVLWNHGAGRLGIASDDVTGNEMSIDRLGFALNQAAKTLGRKLDVFAMDACLMQMASVAYEFRNAADVIVASEEVISGPGYPYTPILNRLAANPGMGAEELGRVIVDSFGASYPDDATLSALRTSALPAFRQALDGWVSAVRSDPRAFAVATDLALLRTVSRFHYEDSKDLIDYVDKVAARLPEGSAAKAAGEALKAQVRGVLLARNVARPARYSRYSAANGLAIYIPALTYDSANYESLTFAGDSLWDDFLLDMMSERLK